MLIEKIETTSTNDDALALATEHAAAGTAVLARRQSEGRGRAGRSWESPRGGFYLSVVLRPRAPPETWGILPPALGAAAAGVLRESGFEVGVKWPNDLWIRGEKVGGILVESRLGPDSFAVAGLGLNLDEVPWAGATALARHGPVPAARALAERLVASFLEVSRRLDAGDAAGLAADVRSLCVHLGRRVAWEAGEGVAVDVDEGGALVVESAGVRTRVVVGDVRLNWG